MMEQIKMNLMQTVHLVLEAIFIVCEICNSAMVKLSLRISQENNSPENYSWSNFKISVWSQS